MIAFPVEKIPKTTITPIPAISVIVAQYSAIVLAKSIIKIIMFVFIRKGQN